MNPYSKFTLLLLFSATLLSYVVSCSTLPIQSYNRSSATYSDVASYNQWHQKNFSQTQYPSEDFGRGGYGYSRYRNDRYDKYPPSVGTLQQQRAEYGVETQREQAEYQQQKAIADTQAQIQRAEYGVETQREQAEYQQQKAIADAQIAVQRAQYAAEKAKQKEECQATGRTDCE